MSSKNSIPTGNQHVKRISSAISNFEIIGLKMLKYEIPETGFAFKETHFKKPTRLCQNRFKLFSDTGLEIGL